MRVTKADLIASLETLDKALLDLQSRNTELLLLNAKLQAENDELKGIEQANQVDLENYIVTVNNLLLRLA